MASENTETNAGNDEEAGPPSETNEHDYAHTVAGDLTSPEASSSSGTPAADGGVTAQGSFTTGAEPEHRTPGHPTLPPVELPEPAVGAEVDCPGGNDMEPQTQDHHPQKTEGTEFAVASASTANSLRRGNKRPKRPEDMNCSCCKAEFERQGRSFNRRAVYTFTTPDTVHWAFPDTTVHEKNFLCEPCAQVIRSRCKRKQSGKRSLWLKPDQTKQSELRDKRKKGRRMGKKSKAAQLVSRSCYKAAFKMLWSAKGARKPMMEFWSKQLKEEMKALTRLTDSPFHQKVSSKKPLASFPWRRCLNWAQEKAPLVTTCLTSLFPDTSALSKSSKSQMSEEQAQLLLERRAVVALSVPLFTRNIWKNNFLQAALGAELRLQGCSGSALDTLNTMGLCQNKDTVRLLLHRLRNYKKMPTQNGRQRMKMKLEQIKGEEMTDGDEEDIENIQESSEEGEEEEEEEEEGDGEEEEGEDDEEDDDEEGEEEEEEEMVIAEVEEEVEQEEVQVDLREQEDAEKAAEMEKKRRKKAKKQRKKERGKRKVKERDEEEVEEEDDEGSEEKKRRVVVVRLGLLKGHSEVGRSDLSAP